jgi:hypothetical protein
MEFNRDFRNELFFCAFLPVSYHTIAIDLTLGHIKVTITLFIKHKKYGYISVQDQEILTPGFGIIRMLLLQG